MHSIQASEATLHDREGLLADIGAHVPQRIANASCAVLVIYYWMMAYSRPSGSIEDVTGLHYAAYVVPAAAFLIWWLFLKAAQGFVIRMPATLFCAFALLAGAVALSRGDLPTVLTAGLAFGVAAALVDLRATPWRDLLNVLFLAAMVAGSFAHVVGWSDYGLLPGSALNFAEEGLEWRVSLFPSLPESAFFALIVFLVNQAGPRRWWRLPMMGLSLFFLVFGGLRTALLAFVVVQAYVYLFTHRGVMARRLFILGTITLFPFALLLLEGFEVLAFSNEFLNQYFLRSEVGLEGDEIQASIVRVWIWAQHLALLQSSPWTGVGTFDFDALLAGSEFADIPTSGSESWLTNWAARTGSLFVIVVIAFAWLAARATRVRSWLPAAALIVFGIASLSYGSVLVPYNVICILLLIMTAAGDDEISATSHRAPRQPT